MKKFSHILTIILLLVAASGKGYAQDGIAAIQNAAEQGDANAQVDLASRYAEGVGVTKDLVQAHMWLNIAASQGKESAIRMHDETAKRMTPAQIAKSDEMARQWKLGRP